MSTTATALTARPDICLAGPDEVHVWRVDLASTALDGSTGILSEDERARAARLITLPLRQHFMRSRCALRLLLAQYAAVPASALQFVYGAHGKPTLAGQAWHFNLSHSGDIALIAIAAQPVGVDVEHMLRLHADIEPMVALVCHPAEKAVFARCPPQEQIRFFYRLWVGKEAYCKALGRGIWSGLDKVRLDGDGKEGGAGGVLRVHEEEAGESAAYFCQPLALGDGAENYCASVCLAGENVRIVLRAWTAQP